MIIPEPRVPPGSMPEARRIEELAVQNQKELDRIRRNIAASNKMFNAAAGGTAGLIESSKDTILANYRTQVFNFRKTNFAVPTGTSTLWEEQLLLEPSQLAYIYASHTLLVNTGSYYNFIQHRVSLIGTEETFLQNYIYIDTIGSSGYMSGVLPVSQVYDNTRGGTVTARVRTIADAPGVGASVNTISELTVFVQLGGNI